jgi:hypothetical protein
MKIFYQHRTWKELAPGEPEEVGVEVLEFDAELYEELEKGLEEGSRLLPVGARKFKEWQVGLLERFDVLEVGRRGRGDNMIKDVEKDADVGAKNPNGDAGELVSRTE